MTCNTLCQQGAISIILAVVIAGNSLVPPSAQEWAGWPETPSLLGYAQRGPHLLSGTRKCSGRLAIVSLFGYACVYIYIYIERERYTHTCMYTNIKHVYIYIYIEREKYTHTRT